MKLITLIFLLTLSISLLTGCNQQPADKTSTVIDTNPAKLPVQRPGEAVATMAGGCFWAVQEE